MFRFWISALLAQRNASTIDSSSRTFARRARLSLLREPNWVRSEPTPPAAISSATSATHDTPLSLLFAMTEQVSFPLAFVE